MSSFPHKYGEHEPGINASCGFVPASYVHESMHQRTFMYLSTYCTYSKACTSCSKLDVIKLIIKPCIAFMRSLNLFGDFLTASCPKQRKIHLYFIFMIFTIETWLWNQHMLFFFLRHMLWGEH